MVKPADSALDDGPSAGARARCWGTPGPQVRSAVQGPRAWWCQRPSGPMKAGAAGCVACSMRAIPTARCAKPSTPKRPSGHLQHPRPQHRSSDRRAASRGTHRTPAFPARSTVWAAPSQRWQTQTSNWHAARVTNAPTKTANNPDETRVKRAAFGFRNFANLPDPGTAARRQTRLETAGLPHPGLKHTRNPHRPLQASQPTSSDQTATPRHPAA